MTIQAVLRSGDATKLNPFTICIVANRYLEAPLNSGTFIPDPIIGNKAGFDLCATYIVDCLTGGLPAQRDGILNDPAILPHGIRPASAAGGSSPSLAGWLGSDREARRFPIPWQKIGNPVRGVIRQTGQHVGEPGLGIDVVELAGLDKGIDCSCPVTSGVGPREGPVFSSDSYHPFILPMSGRSWKSITAGIPTLAIRSSSGAQPSERQADF